MEYEYFIFPLLLILVTSVIFYLTSSSKGSSKSSNESRQNQTKTQSENKDDKHNQNGDKPDLIQNSSSNTLNSKDVFLKSFKDIKDLKDLYFSYDGNYILFHNDKKFSICFLNDLVENNLKFYSKSTEYDFISHVSYADQVKTMAVGLKNSKEILFYELKETDGKFKFEKVNKKIETTRKFEIRLIAISPDGNYIATSGSGQDTEVQIYECKTSKLLSSININEVIYL